MTTIYLDLTSQTNTFKASFSKILLVETSEVVCFFTIYFKHIYDLLWIKRLQILDLFALIILWLPVGPHMKLMLMQLAVKS